MKTESKTIKRVLSFIMVIAMVLSLMPAVVFAADADSKLYLLPDSNWTTDSAWFAAYFFEGDANTWVGMTDEDGDGYFECTAPEGYSNVIFTRMNPSVSALSWDSKWNQTVDLTIPTDGTNCFVIEDPWNESSNWNATGSWTTYAAEEEVEGTSYIVAGTAALCGSTWDPADTGNRMTLNAEGLYEITYESVAAGSHEFKITDGSWTNSWGKDGGQDNYTFTLEAISDVTITFNAGTKEITVTAEVTGEVAEMVECEITLHFVNAQSWGSVALYSWTDAGTLLGDWPGTALSQDSSGYYSHTYTVEVVKGTAVNFIFNNNGGGTQTVDLSLDAADISSGMVEKWVVPTGTDSEGKYICDIVDHPDAIVISPVVEGTSVTFEYKDANASSVQVFGSMNSWASGYTMTCNDYGVWSVTIDDLDPGIYEYKFVADGEWITDPVNSWAQNGNSAFLVLDPDAKDQNEITINVYYERTDGIYQTTVDDAEAVWNAYVWGDGMGGTRFDFAEDENGKMVTTIKVVGRDSTYVALKTRLSTDAKEWIKEESQVTVDLSDIVSGTINVYVTSDCSDGNAGSLSYYQTMETDIVKGNKITDVQFDYDTGAIKVTTLNALTDASDELKVFKDAAEIAADVTENGNTYTLSIEDELTLGVLYQYAIKLDGYTYAIGYSDAYASDKFAEDYTYTGDDLGANWSKESTTFKVWAPSAAAVSVKLYETGTEGTDDLIDTIAMEADVNGSWTVTVDGDLNGTYYTYLVDVDGEEVEAVDPYARTTGVNGNRGMIIDLDSTDPEGWDHDTNPNEIDSYTDAIIYELHVRDFSIDDSSGVSDENQGKYLAFTETGTTTENGVSTGIDYLKNLGVTYIHLLPVYDYASVDETKCDTFNWGYDPQNYNTPEGSYSTDPYNGEVRVQEFKEMVMALHDAGISVIMDVVYNHVYNADTFCINTIVPGYFSRVDSNASGCGNDTASEREMVRKYIVESVLYWHQEYHIDGFRFDLVGLLDVETINEIVETVHVCCPDVVFYGEGWDMDGTNKEDGTEMAKQGNASKTEGFAYFSDTMRNLLAGSNGTSTGYVSGSTGRESEIVSNFMANPWWTSNPQQVVQYASCHDNYTLIDKLIISTGAEGITDDIVSMNNLTAAIYMTSQGISFIHAGEEMLREKLEENGERCENSYNASDYVNHIEWSNLEDETYADTSAYYQGLIAFRKAHAALRLSTSEDVSKYVTNTLASNNVVAFSIDGNGTGDDDLYIIFNANSTAANVTLPEGTWNVCIDKEDSGTETLYTAEGTVEVDGISAMVLTKEDEGEDVKETVTIYYDNSQSQWETVYAYAWDAVTYLGSWPGTAMTNIEGDIWAIEVPAAAVNIIFNNNSGSQTADLVIPTDGANLYDGSSWTTYTVDEEEPSNTITVYYDNSTSKWDTVYAYTWTGSTQQMGAWPGTAMAEGENDIWSVEIPNDTANIIFNSGSGSQTADLIVPTDGCNLYTDGEWTVYGATVYYLFGYINGANYGCEEDYQSMGEYKFVNGSLTATFEQDSYVAVKSEGNENWYMTNGWLGTETTVATLYNTNDLGSDANKLYVPAGYLITFNLVENEDGTLTLSYEIGEKIETGSADDYYLFGYIDGANYGCEDDYYTLGDYKFVDGTVTAKFGQDSYVGVKTGDNATWYMTDGWQGNVTSVTLYNTEDLDSNADKLMVPGGVEVTFTLVENEDGTLTLSYVAAESDDSYSADDTSGIQDGVTLHCWNWSFAEIEKNMATIAEMGYTAIQTSPVQPIKESTTSSTVGDHWWIYYQPIDFTITDDEGNVLGTKAELVSMIESAHEYGIQVIVDVVANHLANETGNDLSDKIPEDLLLDEYWHDITINISNYSDRYEVTQYCMSGLPDLNTASDDVQQMVLDFLNECIDAGVDGFRFDAAKHIETPEDDESFASDFWPTVIGGAEEYAQTTYNKDIYCYGEVLDSINGLAISAYTKYLAVTDNSWGNTLRENVSNGNASISEGYDKAADASQLIIWAESHDTYANDDGASKDETTAEINKTWALVAARADAMGLYLARPESNDQLLGAASVTGWANEEVKAVNEFHNAFVGEEDTVGAEGDIAYVVRGDSGIVLVNVGGQSADVSIAVDMADGSYTEQITGAEFTVENGVISGKIGETGIAVVYNAETEEEPAYTVAYKNVSVTLDGSIGINYYVALSDAILADENAYMQFTVAGKTQMIPVNQAQKQEDGTYKFTCHVAAKQMTDTIVGQIYLSDDTAVGEAKEYSVKAYYDALVMQIGDDETYENLLALLKAMLNYGAYSQVQFGYNTDNLANADLEDTTLPDLTEDAVAAYAHGAEGSEAGISVDGVSLLLESTTTIRFYFNVEEGYDISDYTFYVDGVETTPVQSGDQYYVDKTNVAAKELDEMATVIVGGLTVQYCGLSYTRQVAVLYPTYYSEALVNVAKALYAYNMAANAYFDN